LSTDLVLSTLSIEEAIPGDSDC